MQTWTNKFHLNREGEPFPPGPWNDEKDKWVWIDEASDLDAMIHRNPMGALCGYVGVGPDHPWYRKDYMDVHPDVHGSLTFADMCSEGDDPGIGICHVAQPGRPDPVWWFGFDCGHGGDLIPGMIQAYELMDMQNPSYMADETYKDFDYVKAEVTGLAKQLAEVTT